MAILNQKRILNLIPKVSAPVTIHVSQGDVGTQIEFTLVKGDEVFSNTGNLTASVHGVREDGANFGPFACTLSGSKVTFPLHSEMTAVKGSAIAEIVLVDNGGNKVGSANFGILVEESVFPLGVTYDNDVGVYESILAYVQTIPAQLTNDYTSKINAVQIGLNNEIATRTSEDVLINTRIDEIIAPSGEAPSAAEVTDARIGTNNLVFETLGKAIRTQFSCLIDESANKIGRFPTPFRVGSYAVNANNVEYIAYPNSICSTTYYKSDKYLRIRANTGYQVLAIQNINGTWTTGSWVSGLIINPNVECYLIIRKQPLVAGDLNWVYQVTATIPDIQLYVDALQVDPKLIQSSNYMELLPDVDEINHQSIYALNFVKGDTSIPANLPWSEYPVGTVYLLETICAPYSSSANIGAIQTLRGAYGDIWTRGKYVPGWTDWKCIKGAEITVGVDFGRFIEAVNIANLIPHTTIYVEDGYYDLLTELTTIYPDFLNNYTPNQKHGRGVEIGNDVKIVGTQNAILLCNYNGSDNSFIENFSPLMALASDFEIDGLRIVCSNVRYGIHDDPIGSSEKVKRWHHKYNQLQIRVDNQNSPYNFKACIGGGLGKQSSIEVNGCFFESLGLNDNQAAIGWHNCILNDSVSNLLITNNYFAQGTFRAGYYGPTANISNCIVTNNSMKSAPFVAQEDPNYTNINMIIYSWNNEIRT